MQWDLSILYIKLWFYFNILNLYDRTIYFKHFYKFDLKWLKRLGFWWLNFYIDIRPRLIKDVILEEEPKFGERKRTL